MYFYTLAANQSQIVLALIKLITLDFINVIIDLAAS